VWLENCSTHTHTHTHTHTTQDTYTHRISCAQKEHVGKQDFSGRQARAHTHGMEGGLNLDGVDKVDLEAERLHRKDGALVPNIPVDLLFFWRRRTSLRAPHGCGVNARRRAYREVQNKFHTPRPCVSNGLGFRVQGSG
jgi:hypothetical protein